MQISHGILVSTAYLPPIEYMALVANCDIIILEKEESYPKQTYRNRCVIMTANGLLNLTIPVVKPYGNNTKTKDILILNSNRWFLNHWRAISSAYSGSPFFLYYKDDLEPLFTGKYINLIEFNTKLLEEICKLAGIDFRVEYSSTFIMPSDTPQLTDYRFSISPKNSSLSNQFDTYTQVFSNKYTFKSNLSILDLLFNLGPETKGYLHNVWCNLSK